MSGVQLSPGRRTAALACALVFSVVVVSWAFGAAFHPQYFSFDSYHYLTLAHHPVAYGAHPVVFGYLIRGLAAVGTAFGEGGLGRTFQAWQVGCLFVLVWMASRGASPWSVPRPWWSWGLLGAAAVLTVLVLVPGAVFLMNGFLTGMTALAVTALAARLLEDDESPRRRMAWAGFAVLCLVGYHLRYQLAVLPVAALTVLAVAQVRRGRNLRAFGARAVGLGALILMLPLSQRALATTLPVDEYGKSLPSTYLRASIQCRLDCDVRLFEVGCDTPEGEKKITMATCSDLVHAQVDLGRPATSSTSVIDVFREVGWSNVVRWLVMAPATYLEERMPNLVIESYSYDRNVRALSEHHPETIARYAEYFPSTADVASPWFRSVVDYASRHYFAWRLHWIALLVVWGSAVVVFVSRNRTTAFLAANNVGTFLVFSYVQPQAPLRYLVLMCMLGGVVFWRMALGSRTVPA